MQAASDLSSKIKLLPDSPGVYRFFGAAGEILYIGKAKNLKNRVRTYFGKQAQVDPRTEAWVPLIQDLAWVVTHTEAEALILEEQLIKRHRPKYNIELKDDKSYPYFKLTMNELYPRLVLTREIEKDGSAYFGPYVSAKVARSTEKVIQKHFPLRQSKMELDGSKTYRPCLNYQMQRCLAPCAGLVSPQAYGELVAQVAQILRGDAAELASRLKTQMAAASEAMEFERAAQLRDQIRALDLTLQKQRVLSKDKQDRDVIALVRDGGFCGVQLLFVRGGVLLGDDFIFIKEGERFEDGELLRGVLSRLYVKAGRPLPKEILLPLLDESLLMIEEYCSELRGTKVSMLAPQRGEKASLLHMAQKNGLENLKLKMSEAKSDELILAEVQEYLQLKTLPLKVECFDVSNLQGRQNVAGMVVFENNKPLKSEYRKFKIKSFEGANDYLAMQEVLVRRYSRLVEEGQAPPSLILIDGGKGQVAAAAQILIEMRFDFTNTDLLGLAKGRSEARRGSDKGDEDYEYVIRPNRKNPIPLKKNSKTLHFLQAIRDETHRFAITFHRQVRGKESLQSVLESIPGIGPKKRKALLQHFGGLKKLQEATMEELKQVPGVTAKEADRIAQHFAQEETHQELQEAAPDAALD